MSIFSEEHKTIFDILKEADDDGSDIINGGDAASTDNTADSGGGDDSSATEDTGTDDNAGGDDDNFDIDTSLGDEGSDEEGGDVDTEDTDTSTDDDTGSSSSTGEGEPNPINKDIFTTLSAEDQAMKIKEQKKKFNDMYTYINELIDKIGDIDVEEDTIDIVSRISGNLYRMREYLADYITSRYPVTDYFDNDVFYNRFLLVLYSTDTTLQELAKARAKKLGLNMAENDKK